MRWSTALEPIIDDITTRYEPPTEFVLPGENRIAAALDVARTVVRRAERQAVAAAHAGWLDDSQRRAVPQPPRRSRVHARPVAGGDVPPRPHRETRRVPDRPETSLETPGATVSLSFTVSTTAADRVAADLLAVPIVKGPAFGPGADAVDAALDGGLAAFLAEAGFEGKPGETLAVPDRRPVEGEGRGARGRR